MASICLLRSNRQPGDRGKRTAWGVSKIYPRRVEDISSGCRGASARWSRGSLGAPENSADPPTSPRRTGDSRLLLEPLYIYGSNNKQKSYRGRQVKFTFFAAHCNTQISQTTEQKPDKSPNKNVTNHRKTANSFGGL